jgi:hypothetical protein
MMTVGITDPGWFSVRCVFRDAERSLYEERITLWRADSFADAVASAEAEATEYASSLDMEYLGLAQVYRLADEPSQPGAEVFSLMRVSPMAADEYVQRFFATGDERQRPL